MEAPQSAAVSKPETWIPSPQMSPPTLSREPQNADISSGMVILVAVVEEIRLYLLSSSSSSSSSSSRRSSSSDSSSSRRSLKSLDLYLEKKS